MLFFWWPIGTSFDDFINLKILCSSLSKMLRCAYVCMFMVVRVSAHVYLAKDLINSL